MRIMEDNLFTSNFFWPCPFPIPPRGPADPHGMVRTGTLQLHFIYLRLLQMCPCPLRAGKALQILGMGVQGQPPPGEPKGAAPAPAFSSLLQPQAQMRFLSWCLGSARLHLLPPSPPGLVTPFPGWVTPRSRAAPRGAGLQALRPCRGLCCSTSSWGTQEITPTATQELC